MNNIAIFTIASKNYLAYARTLLQSVRRYHPEAGLYLLLVDEVQDEFVKENEPFGVVLAKDLEIPGFSQMAFKYDIMELNTAVKPFFIKYLLAKGYERVIYFDPDIMLYGRIDPVLQLLENHAIVLTPHLTSPVQDGDSFFPDEEEYLRTGTYNLGFIAVSRSSETDSFISWWSKRCHAKCYNEKETGLFVDQKWINLVPGLYDSVAILRHPGCNVAYWNLHERSLENRQVNGRLPLIFYHFSGINLQDINAISKYQNRFTLDKKKDFRAIFEEYRDAVFSNGHDTCKKWGYAYACFENGAIIGPVARRLFGAISERYENPFSTGHSSYYQLLKKRRVLENGKCSEMTKETTVSEQKILYVLFRIISKVVGIERYNALMKFFRYAAVVRRQEHLLK